MATIESRIPVQAQGINPACPAATHSGPTSLAEVVREATGSNPFKCYQCIKCTSGCPLATEFDLTPNQVLRSVQLNDTAVLESTSIWLCASCYTCATRCPQQIDVTGVMDALCIESQNRGIKPAVPNIALFKSLFLRGIKIFGRTYELGLGAAFNLALGQPLRDFGLGKLMFARGKLKLLPHFAKTKTKIEKVPAGSKAVGFYPGCSLTSTAIEYGNSVRNIAKALDIELIEPKGWSCCGANTASSTDTTLANLLPMKTVAAVEQMGLDTVTSPCSACFSRLKHAEHTVRNNETVGKDVSEALAYDYKGSVEVQHLLDVIVDRAGLDEVAGQVTKPLKGLKVACYYGCLITRPSAVTGAENPEYPVKMDRLMTTLGAQTIDWSRKTECCGGALALNSLDVAIKLMKRIMDDARACGAEAVVTMCPICHLNLDSRQSMMDYDNEIPIFQATQLMALAFGQGEKKAALEHNLIDPKPYLRNKGILP